MMLRPSHRRGVSLVELLVVLSTWSILITISATLLHRVMQSHTESRQFAQHQRTATALSRQFRADIHAATTAETDEEGFLVTLEMTDGSQIDYVTTQTGVMRYHTRTSRSDQTETYPFPKLTAWQVNLKSDGANGKYVVLQSSPSSQQTLAERMPTRHVGPPVRVRVVARLAQEARR